MQESHKEHEGAYPVPSDVSVLNLDDNFRFNKDHFTVNPKYHVSLFKTK
jgi:hypothetical protein